MSQFTFATLVKDNNQSITSLIKKDKASCYWFSVNPTWTAVIMANDTQLGSQTAEKMSNALHTSAFFFLHAEDLTWGYAFFHRGQLVSECYVNYEEKSITIQNVNEAALLEACVDHETYHDFKQWQSNFYQDEHEILNGVHLFKKAFATEKIEWISYDYLSSGSDERIDQLQMQYYQGKKKSIPVKRMIFDSLQESFNQSGFFLDEGMSSLNWFAFSKEDEHGYKYAIT
ncbi:MAG TPA: hypothetical protein VEZ13_18085 [Brevibacillus sp.]|nr:hypothetical protein [Brevibacillus sp.]